MSRKPIIAGNWKMNKILKKHKLSLRQLQENCLQATKLKLLSQLQLDLNALLWFAKDSELKVAAQNCYFEDAGAFTGETSPKVLAEMGVNYVVIGHSERRDYFHETDEDINKKLMQSSVTV